MQGGGAGSQFGAPNGSAQAPQNWALGTTAGPTLNAHGAVGAQSVPAAQPCPGCPDQCSNAPRAQNSLPSSHKPPLHPFTPSGACSTLHRPAERAPIWTDRILQNQQELDQLALLIWHRHVRDKEAQTSEAAQKGQPQVVAANSWAPCSETCSSLNTYSGDQSASADNSCPETGSTRESSGSMSNTAASSYRGIASNVGSSPSNSDATSSGYDVSEVSSQTSGTTIVPSVPLPVPLPAPKERGGRIREKGGRDRGSKEQREGEHRQGQKQKNKQKKNGKNKGYKAPKNVHLYPRRKHGEAERQKDHMIIGLDELKQLFHLPLKQAATKLGICTTALKSVCRKIGLVGWPYKLLKQAASADETGSLMLSFTGANGASRA